MKKVNLGFIALVLALCVVAGGIQPTLAKEKLVIWSIGSEIGSYGQVFAELAPKLEEEFPDLDIEIQFVTGPMDRFITHHLGGIAPDIVTLQTNSAPALIEQGLLAPLDRDVFNVTSDEGLRDLFYSGSINSIYYDDNVYFIPTEVTTMGTYANLDLLNEVGLPADVPTTWEGLLDAARRIARFGPGGELERPGLVLNRGWVWPTFYWPSFIRQAGVDWLEDGVPQFDNPAVVNNIDFYRSMFFENQVMAPTSSIADFQSGNAGFYLGLQYEMFDFANPDLVSFDWTAGAYPHFEGGERVSLSYAWGMYVYSGSSLQREAWEVIEYLTNEEHAPFWYSNSSLLIPRDGAWIIDLIQEDPRRAVFIEELDYAQMEIAHVHGNDVRAAINRADAALINEGQAVGNVMTILNEEVKAILSGSHE